MEGTQGTGAPAPVETPNPQGQPTDVPGGQTAPEGNPAKEAAAEALRKFKLKVDGQEVEVDEEELKRGYTHQKAANKKLQEGLKAKKQAEEFISMMKDKGKLFDAIKKLGHDPRALSEEFLASQLEEEMLDPREKELRDAKNRLKAYEELEKKQKEAIQKQREEELRKKYSEDYTTQFVEALKTTGLPPTKPMVAEMAKYIARSAKIGFEMTAQEAAKLVKEDLELAYRNLYGEADAETLVKLLGDQGLQKIRSFDTQRLKDPNQHLQTPKEQGEVNRQRRENVKRMTPQEWRAFNRAK